MQSCYCQFLINIYKFNASCRRKAILFSNHAKRLSRLHSLEKCVWCLYVTKMIVDRQEFSNKNSYGHISNSGTILSLEFAFFSTLLILSSKDSTTSLEIHLIISRFCFIYNYFFYCWSSREQK